ncbi:Uncharacterised protein [uncultured Clostridium sp.]|nr:Uncharacterised protein [uncultured Clostridium sp.]SCI96065.1 Uncharacterised protein [uncultured Clostridium sp.]
MSVKDFKAMTIEEKSMWFVKKLITFHLKGGAR